MKKELKNEFELKNKSYIKSVDGVRAISVSFVMLYHLMPHLFAGGYLGVLVFFVLSGYFVTENLLTSFAEDGEFRFIEFYKGRFFKIYMTYLPFLCIVSFVVLGFFHKEINHFLPNVISSLSGWNNVYQIINGLSYFETHGVLNPFTHLWFMGVELQFYLCFPLILFVFWKICRGKRIGIGLVVFLLSGVSAALMFLKYSPEQDISRIYYGTDTRAFSLLIGSYFACLFPIEKVRNAGDKTWKNVLCSFFTLVISAGVIWAMVVLDAQLSMMYPFGMYLFSVAVAILLLLLMIRGNIVSDFLALKFFSYLGKRSFSLYLWQYAIMVFVNAQFLWIAIDPLLLVAINLAITFFISEISYQFFEKRRGMKYRKTNRLILVGASFLMLFAIGLPIYMPERFEAQDILSDLKREIREVEEASASTQKEVLSMEDHPIKIHPVEDRPIGLQDSKEVSPNAGDFDRRAFKNINQIIEESQTQDDMMKKIFEDDVETKRRKEEERERELEHKRQLKAQEERKEPERGSAQDLQEDEQDSNAQSSEDELPEDELPDNDLSGDPPSELSSSEERAEGQEDKQPQESKQPQELSSIALRCTFIGDSVMLGSKPNIEKVFPNSVVNAKVSRQAHHLRSILEDMESKGQLYENVIIHLGTNGSIDKQQLIKALQSIGDRNIYLINAVVPRSWESQVNQVIREVADELPNVTQIDWYKEAKGKRELFYKDATHPEPVGREKYTQLIQNALN